MTDRQGTVHISPSDDLIAHENTDECICGPSFELRQFEPPPGYYEMSKHEQDRIDHRDGHIHTHHALDGRE